MKAIDFIMFHDRIYARPYILFIFYIYITIIEKIEVIFSLSDSDDLTKSISEHNIILFM